jgi:hypothetical protein
MFSQANIGVPDPQVPLARSAELQLVTAAAQNSKASFRFQHALTADFKNNSELWF